MSFQFIRPYILSLLGCFYFSRRFDSSILSRTAVYIYRSTHPIAPNELKLQQRSCKGLTT